MTYDDAFMAFWGMIDQDVILDFIENISLGWASVSI